MIEVVGISIIVAAAAGGIRNLVEGTRRENAIARQERAARRSKAAERNLVGGSLPPRAGR